MSWSSILPPYLSLVETWIIRIFLLLCLLTVGPWLLMVVYDLLLYLFRALTYEIPGSLYLLIPWDVHRQVILVLTLPVSLTSAPRKRPHIPGPTAAEMRQEWGYFHSAGMDLEVLQWTELYNLRAQAPESLSPLQCSSAWHAHKD
ncbi:MAG: hypothetical protein FRX48_08398 [Lasallia pustulata]|uniref:Uncharacterized protein n=1 Tax=Lasallia pustulata TaxID=136370 RepID=A0A5M8PFG0_9LECA|nr:MAG: hypothetical protein FRX48_08398 [Lasallia pustulata]